VCLLRLATWRTQEAAQKQTTIVVVYNVELDEIFVISNVTVTIVPIIPYGNIV
jgi:hypothetical protein